MNKLTVIFLGLAILKAIGITINNPNTLECCLAGLILVACIVCAIILKLILSKSNINN